MRFLPLLVSAHLATGFQLFAGFDYSLYLVEGMIAGYLGFNVLKKIGLTEILKYYRYKGYVLWKFAISLHGGRILTILCSILIGIQLAKLQSLKDFVDINSTVAGAGGLAIIYLVYNQLKLVVAQPLAKELKTYLQLPSYQAHLGSLPVMEKNIKALCHICLGKNMSDKNRRLVFFIDDLDRCGVEGIVKTFEAVRLVLDVPWVTVVIAMDQRIALPALAYHYENLSKYHQRDPMSIARNYLAKVIHLPIKLQAPDNRAVAEYLDYIWDDTEFVDKIFAESNSPPIDSVSLDKEPVQEEVASEGEKPKESLQNIIDDINSMDIKPFLQVEQSSSNTDDAEIIKNMGFGAEQKDTFYKCLIHFNLRNPRQIKRLYNSYNLLWSIYGAQWSEEKKGWQAYMQGLLVLEMINEYVPFDGKTDTKEQYRQALFSLDTDKKINSIENIESKTIDEAYKVIFAFQKEQKINLLTRIEPFLLPALRPAQKVS